MRRELVSVLLVVALGSLCSAELPWISVQFSDAAGRYILKDDNGREFILRGVNVEHETREALDHLRPIDPSLYKNSCPANDPNYQEPPICEVDFGRTDKWSRSFDFNSTNDFTQIRFWGFNAIRLCISWQQLEPEAGVYDEMYIDRLQQLVEWAQEQDIYTILDMHEDWYSFFLPVPAQEYPPWLRFSYGQDGAPAWSTVTDGLPSLSILGLDPLNLAQMRAFDHFYNNDIAANVSQGMAPGPGLQDHYIGAIAALAKRFYDYPSVLGFEIINEPQMGSHVLDAVGFASNYLYPMYTRVIQAITGVRDGLPTCESTTPLNMSCAYPDLGIHDTRHIFFFEPAAVRNTMDFALQISTPFTTYSNLVYTPHTYTHVFTLDRVLNIPYETAVNLYPPSYDFAYVTAHAEALAMHAAVLPTEYGCGPDWDDIALANTTAAQDTSRTGSMLWSWKSNGGSWTMYSMTPDLFPGQNGPVHPTRQEYMGRVYPRVVVGQLVGYMYDPRSQLFVMHANHSSDQGPQLSTEVFIPAHVKGQVSFTGSVDPLSSRVVLQPDGTRLALVTPTGLGEYSITVSPSAIRSQQQQQQQQEEAHSDELLSSAMEQMLKTSQAFDQQVAQTHTFLQSLSSEEGMVDTLLGYFLPEEIKKSYTDYEQLIRTALETANQHLSLLQTSEGDQILLSRTIAESLQSDPKLVELSERLKINPQAMRKLF